VTEPRAVASEIEEVVPGVWHWAIEDERIGGFVSSAHAVRTGAGVVLIDPLPVDADVLARLGPVEAIVLTAGTHERSAWRLRGELGAKVYAPAAVKLVAEEPDVRYAEGDELPAGLQPIFAPGPGTTQHALLLGGERPVLFTSDLFVHPKGYELDYVPDEFVHDPAETRRTARKLLDVDFDVLCVGHGVPIAGNARDAVRHLVERGE